jgi:aminoglycoside phosphotransferase (APT) family kinase protein
MSQGPMHAGETVVSLDLAARLVAAQFPGWAGLPLRLVPSGGSDNVLVRLGRDMVLRFPRLEAAAAQVTVEAGLLPVLGPLLPLRVPEVLAVGQPGLGYPHPWLVLRWLPGADAFTTAVTDDLAAARALAGFVGTLRAVPVPEGAPVMSEGGHLRPRDGFTRQMIARITDEADPADVTCLWEEALALPPWDGVPVLVHRDLHPLNLLVTGDEISAVIDWGAVSAGDPAHDLICGWTLLGDAGRALFRELLAVDGATWARGRALAFSKAVMAAPYYRTSNPPLRDVMRRTLRRAMADWPD